MMREFIAYDPPKGNLWGHTLRHRTVQRAWDAIETFLAACTIAEPVLLRTLTAHGTPPWEDSGVAKSYEDEVTAAFGPSDRISTLGVESPTGGRQEWHDEEWDAGHLELGNILTFLTAQEPWPKQRRNTVSARLSVRFQWRDPNSGEPLDGQSFGFATPDGALHSHLAITLGPRTHIQPGLCFPYPEGSPRLPALVEFAQRWFPATLNAKHFRVAVPTAKGTGFRLRKLVISPFTAA